MVHYPDTYVAEVVDLLFPWCLVGGKAGSLDGCPLARGEIGQVVSWSCVFMDGRADGPFKIRKHKLRKPTKECTMSDVLRN